MREMNERQKLALHYKKLALFFAPNGVWDRLHAVEEALWGRGEAWRIPHLVAKQNYRGPLKHKIDESDLPKTLPAANPQHYHVRMSAKTIEAWRSLESTNPPEHDTAALAHLCEAMSLLAAKLSPADHERTELDELIALVGRYGKVLTDHSVSLQKAMKIIGTKAQDGYKSIDRAYQKKAPLLSLAWYPQQGDTAKEDLRKIGGLFKAWVKRGTGWFQCMIQVRYELEVLNHLVLRAKLHVPNVRVDEPMRLAAEANGDSRPHWTYDGIVRVIAGRHYFLFEKRKKDDQDFFFLITEDSGKKHDGCGLIVGQYLTSGQDPQLSPVGDVVVMKRLATAATNEKETLRQHETMKMLVRELPETGPEAEEMRACVKLTAQHLSRKRGVLR